MALDLATLTANALSTATGVGVTGRATITRPVPAPNPLTGAASSVSAITQTVDAVAGSPRRFGRRSDAKWADATLALFIASARLTFAPAVGHTCQYGGITMRLVAVDEYLPTGAVIGYVLGLAT